MTSGHPHRWLIAALVTAVAIAATAVELIVSDRVDSQREDRIAAAHRKIDAALRERILLLSGIADMIDVNSDVAPSEIERFARTRSRLDPALVSVQWLRPSRGDDPTGQGEALHSPVIVPAQGSRNDPLARADTRRVARGAIGAASQDHIATSPPIDLSGGNPAIYIAVPVDVDDRDAEARSGSLIVGLVDTQVLARNAIGDGPATSVSDVSGELAAVGGEQRVPVTTTTEVHGREWTISVEGGIRTSLERALPWLILLAGLLFTTIVAALLGRAIRRRDEALAAARERAAELEQRSREDELTGAFNRRYFGERLARELSRGGEGVAVLLIDLDEFKQVNDEHGHLAGDAALRVTATRLAETLRGSECFARWGGEEFAVLVPRIGHGDAVALGERLREAVSSRPIDVGAVELTLTASVGVALTADGLRTPDELVGAADRALYAAKDAGRDAVRAWRPEPVDAPAPTGSPLP